MSPQEALTTARVAISVLEGLLAATEQRGVMAIGSMEWEIDAGCSCLRQAIVEFGRARRAAEIAIERATPPEE